MLVPMIATSVPGWVTVTAGAETWASTFATATGVPARRPVHAAACSPRPPARLPIGSDLPRELVVDDVLEPRVESGEVRVVGEAVVLRPHRLVARGAARAGLDPGQLPDDPVAGIDQAVGAGVELRCLVEDLERLGEEPFG